jgi:hypothetical protein
MAGLALLMSGCEHHNGLINQIAEARIELDAAQKAVGQAELELARVDREENDLRSLLPLRLGSETTLRKIALMRVQNEALKKHKDELEKSLGTLQADFKSYSRKYL